MKKILVSLLVGLIVGAAVIYFVVPGTAAAKKVASDVKTSFDAVTSKLDAGGNFYLYAGTEKIVKYVDELAGKLRKIVEQQAAEAGESGAEGLKIFDFIHGLIKNCGLMEVSGIGLSSVTIDAKTNLNHSKFVLYHYKEKGKGLIWNLMAEKPHDLNELELLPADTVIAGFADFKIKTLWQWIKKEVEASDLPKLKQTITGVEPMLQQQGLPLDKMMDSLAGRVGFVLFLDSDKKSAIPMGKAALEIPDPAIAIVFSVKDDFLFSILQKMIPVPPKPGDKDIKKIQIPVPPMPITVEPVIMQKQGLLIFASNNRVVEAMFTAKEKGNGLTATDEFKQLSARIPKKGNSFRFIGNRLFKTIMDIQKKALEATGEVKGKDNPALKVFDLFDKDMSLYGVSQNSDEGVVFTFNHHLDLEGIVLLPVTIPVGIAAAIAIPNLITATQKGKQKSTMGDMKSMSVAIESYLIDNGKAPEGKTVAEIKDQLQPFYIKTLPLKDAWGNDFLYTHGTGDKKKEYSIGSAGKDGVFNGWEQSGSYWVRSVRDFGNDIIISKGMFTYGPHYKR